jgi:voltage-gated potassium channel
MSWLENTHRALPKRSVALNLTNRHIITHAADVVLDLEDVVICYNSPIAKMSLREIKIPGERALLSAIEKIDSEKLECNPSSDETLLIGDTIIVLGRQEQVIELRRLACDNGIRQF